MKQGTLSGFVSGSDKNLSKCICGSHVTALQEAPQKMPAKALPKSPMKCRTNMKSTTSRFNVTTRHE
jgi:hypothetical protein